jgi:hypothetical protein
MISAPRKARSLVFGEAMADKITPRKTMPVEPTETAAAEMTTPTEMAAAPSSVAATKATPAATMATPTSFTMCERGGGRQRQHAGQRQTGN